MLRNLRRTRLTLLNPINNIRRVTTHIKTTPHVVVTPKRNMPLRNHRLNTTINRSSRRLFTINRYLIRRDERNVTSTIQRIILPLAIKTFTLTINLRPHLVVNIILRLSMIFTLRTTRTRLLRILRSRGLYLQRRRPNHLNHPLRQDSVSRLQISINPTRPTRTLHQRQSITLTLVTLLNIMFNRTIARRVSRR